MEEIITKAASAQGLWALLFVFLLFWVLRENSRREAKYQEIINKLSEEYSSIKEGIKDLNNKFEDWMIK